MTGQPTSTSDPAAPPRPACGLTTAEAERRLIEHGPNEPAAAGGRRFIEAWQLLTNPLVAVLVIAAGMSAFMGDVVAATIIVVIVVVGAALDFVQTRRSQIAVARLNSRTAATATVLRDAMWREIDRRLVVPGDVVRLSAGDLIPADCRLLEANDLHVQQAALTGESMPVEKSPAASSSAADATGAGSADLFLGTSVVSGTATAVVAATGRDTALGDIAARLAARPPETEFERGTRRFAMLIFQVTVFLVLFVFLVKILLRHDAFESLLFAVALAVGLTPEFLPMIMTITLAAGAKRMADCKVIVKHLSAIQNFGGMDILCSDKTGTLTGGEMTLERRLDPLGRPSDTVFLPAYLNSCFETGIKSPLDSAIQRAEQPSVAGYVKLDEIPFDFERRRLSVVLGHEGRRRLVMKGAPESVVAVCTAVRVDDATLPFDADLHERCRAAYDRLNAEGLRVLAVAEREVPEQAAYRAADEAGLTLLGFLAFSDPPLPDTREVLATLRRDGVHVKILSGDNELTVRRVCELVGLRAAEPITGADVERMTDAALGRVAERHDVFARLSPSQKTRVVLALKRRGHVVGFLGDGINDAPSLHAADVGISVAAGVDVAKEAADIILLERNLGVLHSGVIEGRKAFGNVSKYLLMGTSSNFGNMLTMAGASLFLPFLPMLPTQILLNNFLYDLAQVTIPSDNVDPTFLRKPRHWDVASIRRFMLLVGPISSLFDCLIFVVLWTMFHGAERAFQTGWFVESLATQTLVLFVIRTAGSVWRSRPSKLLATTTAAVVVAGIALPYSPLAPMFQFVPPPLAFYPFLVAVVAGYLLTVEFVKRRLFHRLFR